MSVKLTIHEFKIRAINTHGKKYNYSKVDYINNRTKICIICPEHGEFWQSPYHHTSGQGCPKCVNKNKTLKIILAEFNLKHNNKYNYSKVKYINSKIKICIICPEHGEFWQTPNNHLNSNGCYQCGVVDSIKKHVLTTQKFINIATIIHNNIYDYSNAIYLHSKSKVCIICPEHGEFWQTPNAHRRGQGCPKCAITTLTILQRKPQNKFITQASKIHNDKYDYSKAKYINSNTKICIICPKHGEFWQSPPHHLNNHGCPKCKSSHGEKQIRKLLKSFNIKFEEQYKFDNCKNKERLAFDFFIPSMKILIEYDGEQHFTPIKHFGGVEKYEYLKKCDSIKNKFAESNGYLLLRIPYTNIKNIKEILKKSLLL